MKATRKTIPTLIEQREPFKNGSGTLKAGRPTGPIIRDILSKDVLNETEKSRLQIDHEQSGIAYLIMSFDTPIAWETKTGHVYKVQQTFTQTTSKHQGLLYLFHPKDRRV